MCEAVKRVGVVGNRVLCRFPSRGGDLPHREAPRVEGEDLVIEPGEPPRVLGNQLRLEGPGPISSGTSVGFGVRGIGSSHADAPQKNVGHSLILFSVRSPFLRCSVVIRFLRKLRTHHVRTRPVSTCTNCDSG